jgi:hypothetical protein
MNPRCKKNCKHQFDKPFETRYGYYDQQCLKCHHIKKGKMPISKETKRNIATEYGDVD